MEARFEKPDMTHAMKSTEVYQLLRPQKNRRKLWKMLPTNDWPQLFDGLHP